MKNRHKKRNSAGSKPALPAATGKTEAAKTVETKYAPPCHTGFAQIHKDLYVGRERDLTKFNLPTFDILVPLVPSDYSVWDDGFRGSIHAVPIKDFCILPDAVAEKQAEIVAEYVKAGKKCAIFCMGGHGRTGYFASLVLGKLGYSDPIAHIREKHCKEAVETREQIRAVARILKTPALEKHDVPDKYGHFGFSSRTNIFSWDEYYGLDETPAQKKSAFTRDYCGACVHFISDEIMIWQGMCAVKTVQVRRFKDACDTFVCAD